MILCAGVYMCVLPIHVHKVKHSIWPLSYNYVPNRNLKLAMCLHVLNYGLKQRPYPSFTSLLLHNIKGNEQ